MNKINTMIRILEKKISLVERINSDDLVDTKSFFDLMVINDKVHVTFMELFQKLSNSEILGLLLLQLYPEILDFEELDSKLDIWVHQLNSFTGIKLIKNLKKTELEPFKINSKDGKIFDQIKDSFEDSNTIDYIFKLILLYRIDEINKSLVLLPEILAIPAQKYFIRIIQSFNDTFASVCFQMKKLYNSNMIKKERHIQASKRVAKRAKLVLERINNNTKNPIYVFDKDMEYCLSPDEQVVMLSIINDNIENKYKILEDKKNNLLIDDSELIELFAKFNISFLALDSEIRKKFIASSDKELNEKLTAFNSIKILEIILLDSKFVQIIIDSNINIINDIIRLIVNKSLSVNFLKLYPEVLLEESTDYITTPLYSFIKENINILNDEGFCFDDPNYDSILLLKNSSYLKNIIKLLKIYKNIYNPELVSPWLFIKNPNLFKVVDILLENSYIPYEINFKNIDNPDILKKRLPILNRMQMNVINENGIIRHEAYEGSLFGYSEEDLSANLLFEFPLCDRQIVFKNLIDSSSTEDICIESFKIMNSFDEYFSLENNTYIFDDFRISKPKVFRNISILLSNHVYIDLDALVTIFSNNSALTNEQFNYLVKSLNHFIQFKHQEIRNEKQKSIYEEKR